ncbi:MAG: hypothetical protein CJBNEKGG_03175 [Prosthecobacter sp.]|nr:hypothetical protein [Prosthecobacter sp.]
MHVDAVGEQREGLRGEPQLRLARVRRRLANTKSPPPRTCSLSCSQTAACRPSKPLRMSQGSSAMKTFKLPVKLSMALR